MVLSEQFTLNPKLVKLGGELRPVGAVIRGMNKVPSNKIIRFNGMPIFK